MAGPGSSSTFLGSSLNASPLSARGFHGIEDLGDIEMDAPASSSNPDMFSRPISNGGPTALAPGRSPSPIRRFPTLDAPRSLVAPGAVRSEPYTTSRPSSPTRVAGSPGNDTTVLYGPADMDTDVLRRNDPWLQTPSRLRSSSAISRDRGGGGYVASE
jgi:hypothetical protein